MDSFVFIFLYICTENCKTMATNQKCVNAVHAMLRQMAEDKRKMAEYFKKHGTYNGYEGQAKFARPF